MRSLQVALVTLGSAGDVHPMLALGQALQERGHRVLVLTNPAFRDAVLQTKLEFRPLGTEDHLRATITHPKLWHPVDGLGVMWRYLLHPALEETCEELLQLHAQGLDVVVAGPMAMGARIAQEVSGVPLVTTYTAATMLRTVEDPMTVAHWRVPPGVPRRMRRWIWAALDRFKLEPLVRPALERVRVRYGLAPLCTSTFGHWMHSPTAGLALFPAWFAQAHADWPAQVTRAGFMLYGDDAAAGLGPSLQEFLAAGPAPVVVMPGSARQDAEAVFAAARMACRALGLRSVLLGAGAGTAQHDHEWCAAYAPFSLLLPQARALVHHAGAGSCAQALQSGLPQLALPSAYDQFDNAMRLEQLGVGITVPMTQVTPVTLTRALDRLVESPAIASSCSHWSAKLDTAAARQLACERVEACAA